MIFRTASLISSLRASPSATPWASNSFSLWLVRSEAGILVSTGIPPLAAGANRRRLVWIPSKSASPSCFPASLRLHPAQTRRWSFRTLRGRESRPPLDNDSHIIPAADENPFPRGGGRRDGGRVSAHDRARQCARGLRPLSGRPPDCR